MKIWTICQYFKPEVSAPSARLGGFAKYWAQQGHDVSVLSSVPNHPTGIVKDDYAHIKSHEIEVADEGYRILRHNFYMSRNKGFIKRSYMHLSFALHVLRVNYFNTPLEKPDIILASSPSFFPVISAWLLARKYKVPFIFEVRDLWPGIFKELGTLKNPFILKTLEKIELFLYRKAAAVVTVTKGFAKDIANRGIDPKKLFIITNGVSDDEYETAKDTVQNGAVQKLRGELQLNPMTKVMLYIGTHGPSQALGQIIDAARTMMDRSDILFLFVGNGADKERIMNLAKGMPNVEFKDAVTKEEVWAYYNMAHINFVPLKDIPGFETTIPSKMFEIFATGTPIVGCLRGEAAEILTNSKAAIVVEPENPEQLSEAILEIADSTSRSEKMRKNGPDFVKEHYLHSKLGQYYINIFNKILNDEQK